MDFSLGGMLGKRCSQDLIVSLMDPFSVCLEECLAKGLAKT